MTLPSVARWGLFTLNLTGPMDTSSFNAFHVALSATFECGNASYKVGGFYDGDTHYRIRFSPPVLGKWHYVTQSPEPTLSGVTGELLAVAPIPRNHGPVESHGFQLVHADGTPHLSFGSTSYAWASQPHAMQEETLATLAQGYFNKQRMTIFPKWYIYNHANPVEAGTAFPILPGSVAANQTTWACVGSDCPSRCTPPRASCWRRGGSRRAWRRCCS